MTVLNGENDSFFGQGIVPTLSDRMWFFLKSLMTLACTAIKSLCWQYDPLRGKEANSA